YWLQRCPGVVVVHPPCVASDDGRLIVCRSAFRKPPQCRAPQNQTAEGLFEQAFCNGSASNTLAWYTSQPAGTDWKAIESLGSHILFVSAKERRTCHIALQTKASN